MPQKKVNFGSKPASQPQDLDEWVSNRHADSPPDSQKTEQKAEEKPVKMKRLTLDIPESMHKRLKIEAVNQGVTMADLLRELIAENYGS